MENEKILLSVVIPCYNCERTLRQCVESVVSECKSNNLSYEIILVNDGATDDTFELCDKLKRENDRILVISQTNSGPSSARNNGIRNAHGELIAFNDSDDMWLPGKLKVQLDYLQKNPDVDLVCAKYGDGKLDKPQLITYSKEVFHNFFNPQTSVLRRSICQKNLFPENQKYSEDMHFLLDVMIAHKCVYQALRSTVPVFKKRIFGEAGLSSHLWEMEKGELKNISYARQLRKISLVVLFTASVWSLGKYFRRCFISIFVKLFNRCKK